MPFEQMGRVTYPNCELNLKTNLVPNLGSDDNFFTKSPIETKNTEQTGFIELGFAALVNPQAAFSKDILQLMGKEPFIGGAFGGQVTYVLNQGLAMAGLEEITRCVIVSQQSSDLPGIESADENISVGEKVLEIKRFPVSPGGEYTDKEKVEKIQVPRRSVTSEFGEPEMKEKERNTYYYNLHEFSKKMVQNWLDEESIPGMVVLPYFDAMYVWYLAEQMLQERGIDTSSIKVVVQPHSLGWQKFKTMIDSEIGKKNQAKKNRFRNEHAARFKIARMPGIAGVEFLEFQAEEFEDYDESLKVETHISPRQIIRAINKLANDPKFLAPFRIAMERLAHSWNAVVNVELEKDLLTKGPEYQLPTDLLPAPVVERIKTIYPGISNLFYFRSGKAIDERNPEIEAAMPAAIDRDNQAMSRLPEHRRNLPSIVVAGRFEERKGFATVVKMFAQNPELAQKYNLKLIIQGYDDALSATNIKKEDFKLLQEIKQTIKSNPKLEESIVSCYFPGNEYKAILQHWGEENQKPGGKRHVVDIHSHYEPFGLVPIEVNAAGLVVFMSRQTNARELYEQTPNSIHLFDYNNVREFSKALEATFKEFEQILQIQMGIGSSRAWEKVAQEWLEYFNSMQSNRLKSKDFITLDVRDPRIYHELKQLWMAAAIEIYADKLLPRENREEAKSQMLEDLGIGFGITKENPDTMSPARKAHYLKEQNRFNSSGRSKLDALRQRSNNT